MKITLIISFIAIMNFNSSSFISAFFPTQMRSLLVTQLSASKTKPQSFDFTSLSLVVEELSKACIPSKLENIVQEDNFNIAIHLKTSTGSLVWINLSW